MGRPVNDTAKERILAAASALFLEGGAAALSVRALAARAGLSTMGLYSHFNGKQGILDALYVEGFGLVAQAIDGASGASPRQIVMDAAARYLDMADGHRAHYRLIFGQADPGYTPSPEARQVGARAFARMTSQVATLLPPDAPVPARQDAAMQVWSLLHGAVALRDHAVADMVAMEGWRDRTLAALELLIDGIRTS